MKKMIMILVIAVAATATVFAQTELTKDVNNSVQTQIIALEKAGWEAWKNKNTAWFQTNLSEDSLHVDGAGVTGKAQALKSLADCEIRGVSLENFKFMMLDKNSALITFTGMQDGVCGGKTIPAKVNASSVYVRRNGKWLNVFYTETPAVQ